MRVRVTSMVTVEDEVFECGKSWEGMEIKDRVNTSRQKVKEEN